MLGGLALATVLAWTAFEGAGGLSLAKTTYVWLGIVPLSAILIAFSIVRRGLAGLNGWAVLVAISLLTFLVGASIAWSLTPDLTWLEFDRIFAYLLVLAAGVASVRLWQGQWAAVLYGLLATVIVLVGYALMTKIAPAWLAPDEIFARLRAPFSYWNAVGLTSAFGVPLCLWLGTAPQLHRLLNASAYPILGLCIVALLMSFSRGGLAVAIVVCGTWFLLVAPLRLRGLAVLTVPAALAALVVAWAFNQSALTQDSVDLAARKSAGVELGLLLLALVAIAFAAGLTVDWIARNRPLSTRSQARVGKGALVVLALVPVVLIAALAASNKGLIGSIESGWHSLTSEQARTPPNSPGRLTTASSVRAHYWREAFRIWKDHRYKGAGGGSFEVVRKRYRTSPVVVAHAHGQIPQALADLGLAGAFLTLIAGLAWAIEGGGALQLWPKAGRRTWNAERQGLVAIALVAFAFGLHTAIDWTWYVPGVALPALFAAGWVAGRGPLPAAGEENSEPDKAPKYALLAIAVLVLMVAIFAVWTILLPLLSSNKSDSALQLAAQKRLTQAEAAARKAHDLNPTSVEPYFTLNAIERSAGNPGGGLRALQQAVRLQPANPQPWTRLGNYLLFVMARPAAAANVLARAVLLDPQDPYAQYVFFQTQQALELRAKREREAKKRRLSKQERTTGQRPLLTTTPSARASKDRAAQKR